MTVPLLEVDDLHAYFSQSFGHHSIQQGQLFLVHTNIQIIIPGNNSLVSAH